MRQISEDRRHALGLLLKRLEELAAARRELLRQLEELDVQVRAAQHAHNIVHNADATTSDLPDEILAMIFEEGMHQEYPSRHFGVLVSHVSHRWRQVALANSRLWSSIRLIRVGLDFEFSSRAPTDEEDGPHPEGFVMRERAAAFLSRAMPSSVNIHISNFRKVDFSTALLQFIKDNIGRCSQLRILDSDNEGLMRMLKSVTSQHMPVLSFIHLGSSTAVAFQQPLFPSGAPRLETAQLDGLELHTMSLCLPAFGSVTSLRLTDIWMEGAEEYNAFRDCLMAIPSLNHFEIELFRFRPSASLLPILLPTIQFLHVCALRCSELLKFIGFIRMPSLATISLQVESTDAADALEALSRTTGALEHLPLLQHLIFTHFPSNSPIYGSLARIFSSIERLTHIETSENPYRHPIDGLRVADGGFRWPNLRTMAVSTPDEHFDPSWKDTIFASQGTGQPIRKLMLPQAVILNGASDMMELRDIIEIEAFHVDWPDPFQRESERIEMSLKPVIPYGDEV